jgi:hypothetical protein
MWAGYLERLVYDASNGGSTVVQYTDSVVPSLLIWRLLQEVVPFLESVVEVQLSLVTSFRPGVVVEYSPRQPAQLD